MTHGEVPADRQGSGQALTWLGRGGGGEGENRCLQAALSESDEVEVQGTSGCCCLHCSGLCSASAAPRLAWLGQAWFFLSKQLLLPVRWAPKKGNSL